ncbi:MAG: hypothetical protein A2065_00735 [Alphaproteobacteria bacterium GWB1_45_5]|nr:MAG: hypothetical protein A2065_00735 [Alphaproteobacteria bacterium GWB1_45_5]
MGILSLGFLWRYSTNSEPLIFGVFSSDKLAVGSKLIVFMLGVPWLGLGAKGIRRSFQRENMRSFEYPSLLLFSMLGSFLLVSSSHLGGIFVALSLQIVPVLVATSLYEDKTASVMWGTKYFILDGICLSFFVFGAALFYGAVGDLNLKSIALFCQTAVQEGGDDLRIVIAFFMIFVVFLLRLAAFPFHLWIKGFYEASSNLVVPFMITIYFSVFIVLVRLLFEGFSGLIDMWKPVLFCVGLCSCLWGAIGALFQTNIRSFFSYNYMFHLGMVLLGLASGIVEGLQASLLYWVVYTLSASVFFFFWSNLSVNDQMLDTIDQAKGLGVKHPAFTLLISLTLLSLASVPPLAGFWCKLYVLKSLIPSGWIYVSALLFLTIIASFQYFHIIRAIYFSDQGTDIRITYEWRTIWTIAPLILVGFFLFQDGALNFIKEIVKGI